jgi:hypothetical protein
MATQAKNSPTSWVDVKSENKISLLKIDLRANFGFLIASHPTMRSPIIDRSVRNCDKNYTQFYYFKTKMIMGEQSAPKLFITHYHCP